MESSSWKLLHPLPLFLPFFLILPLPPAISTVAAVGAIRVELRRVDANGNFSKMELLQRAASRSHHRLARLAASPAGGDLRDAQAPVHAGNGEFLMDVALGTPPVAFSAIVDTGSDLIWTQCQPCVDCFDQPSPIFNPAKSSTYSNLPCSSSLCAALPSAACSSSGCEYLYTYGDSSSTQGVLAADTFSLGSHSPAKIAGIAFGCGNDNQGAGFSQGGGLVGLGRGPLSLVSQLGLGRFSYCLTSLDASKSSPLHFGSVAGAGVTTTTKLVKNSEQPSFYYLSLKGISVGGQRLAIPEGTFDLRGDGTGGLIIDSGTSITYLEAEGYQAVKKAFLTQMKLPAAEGGEVGLDSCFSAPAGDEAVVEVPKLVLHFDGGADLELPAENYMILDPATGLLCLTVMGSRGISILGNFQQQNMQVVYDLEKETLSFAQTRCDQL